MSFDTIGTNAELQVLCALLIAGAFATCYREWRLAGRWIFQFALVFMSIITPHSIGFAFLLVADAFSFFALELPREGEQNARTSRFILSSLVTTLCMLAAVIAKIEAPWSASVPLYAWIYFNFVGLPLGLGRLSQDRDRDVFIPYLFCFALAFRQLISPVSPEEWSTVLLFLTLASMATGLRRVTAALAILGLAGQTVLHFALGVSALIFLVPPAYSVLMVLPISVLAWLSVAAPQDADHFWIYPALCFFGARGIWIGKPQFLVKRWAPITFVGVLGIAGIIYFNLPVLNEIYLSHDLGEQWAWLALASGIIFWNTVDRKVERVSRPILTYNISEALAQRWRRRSSPNQSVIEHGFAWNDIIPESVSQNFLKGNVQLTLWFALMCGVLAVFFWVTVS